MTRQVNKAKNKIPSLFNFDVDLPANPYISGGVNLSIGNTTLAAIGLLTLGTLYFLIRKKR